MIPLDLVNLDEARRTFGGDVERYAQFFYTGDAMADAVVSELAGRPGGFRVLHEAFATGIDSVADAPPSLIRLLHWAEDVPPWVDWKRIALGARTFQRAGPYSNIILSAVSLMIAYRSSVANRPLIFTGALEKQATRRLAETGRFVVSVCQQNGLRRGQSGYQAVLRVRLVHAKVRAMLWSSPQWDARRWGTPINQANMAGTTLLFSYAFVQGLRGLGFDVSEEEGDALMHLWRYAGLLSGVDPSLVFDTEKDAQRLWELGCLIQPPADEGGRALATALSKAAGELVGESRFERAVGLIAARYIDGLSRALNGDELADDLVLPHRSWKYSVYPTRVALRSAEAVRRRMPLGTRVAAFVGNRMLLYSAKKQLRGVEPSFAPPRALGIASA